MGTLLCTPLFQPLPSFSLNPRTSRTASLYFPAPDITLGKLSKIPFLVSAMVAHNRSMYPELAFNSLAAQAGLELLILLHLLPER